MKPRPGSSTASSVSDSEETWAGIPETSLGGSFRTLVNDHDVPTPKRAGTPNCEWHSQTPCLCIEVESVCGIGVLEGLNRLWELRAGEW
jgi:hypothetical protein